MLPLRAWPHSSQHQPVHWHPTGKQLCWRQHGDMTVQQVSVCLEKVWQGIAGSQLEGMLSRSGHSVADFRGAMLQDRGRGGSS